MEFVLKHGRPYFYHGLMMHVEQNTVYSSCGPLATSLSTIDLAVLFASNNSNNKKACREYKPQPGRRLEFCRKADFDPKSLLLDCQIWCRCLKQHILVYCKKVKGVYSWFTESHNYIRNVTCHMRSQSVTCHPTQVNAPRLNPMQPVSWYSIYLSGGWGADLT